MFREDDLMATDSVILKNNSLFNAPLSGISYANNLHTKFVAYLTNDRVTEVLFGKWV